MSRKYTLYQVDAFTKEKFSGNAAGVVTNASLLTEEEMQRIAREMNISETVFIFPPEDHSHHAHLRFFTPTREVPLCGHATVAAHYVRAVENAMGNARVLHKTGAGILPVEIVLRDGDYSIVMTQGAISYGEVLEGEVLGRLASALGIGLADLRHGYPVQIVSTGYGKVMVCIRDEALLLRLCPDMAALCSLSADIGCNGYYVFTHGKAGEEPLVHGRMFGPASGISEDPVTGNANGPLGAYLVHHKLVEHDGTHFRFRVVQGEAMGRPGGMTVDVLIDKGEPCEVRLTGTAVIVFVTELTLP